MKISVDEWVVAAKSLLLAITVLVAVAGFSLGVYCAFS